MVERNYRPAGPTLQRFHDSNAFVRIIEGPVGSGKSTGSSIEIIRRSHMQAPGPDGKRHTRWAVIRNTFPELLTTTIPTFRTWLPVGNFRQSSPPTITLKSGDLDMEVLFLALDNAVDVKKLLSLELTGAWCNELRELPKAVIDQLTGRVGRYPAMADGGPTWFGVLGDTNMPDQDHWLHRLAEEATPEGWEFFRQPGGVIKIDDRWQINPDAENVANLPKDYYRNQLAGKSEDWIKVYLAAQYGYVIDGRPVFPEWSDSLHVAHGPLQPIATLPLGIGVDFGLTPAAVFGQRDVLGAWNILDELIADDMGVLRFSELINQRLAEKFPDHMKGSISIWGDPAGNQRSQVDERTAMAVLREATGLKVRAAPTNDFTVRREAVGQALSRLIDRRPGFLVSPNCMVLRKGFAGGYHFRRIRVTGEEKYHDRPDKNSFSHPHDALQYLLLGGGEGNVVMRRKERRQHDANQDAVRMRSPFDRVKLG